MPDQSIGSLPQVPNLDDGSLMVVEQQGQAMKMTGAQFKEFGKQGLVADMQGYVNAAQQAASSAQDAVSAVTDMTVEAHSLESGQGATVAKTMKNGVFNLSFGLPRGEQGIPGPDGKDGPRGPKGDPGNGLKILGYYDTAADLAIAQPGPEPGDAYGIGTEAPYDIYIYDGVNGIWRNNGPLSAGGGGGTILPENVVTAEGGAVMAFSGLGDAPFDIEITDEEEPPLSASDIVYQDGESVEDALEGLFTSVSDGKALVASAITDKGVPTEEDAAFADLAENILQITTGASTEDATATPGDILAPKTAYTASGKVEGIIPSLGAQTITPGTADKTISNGQYLSGTQVIKGDTNLVSSNIKKGVSIFGVIGAVEQNFLATLTVTVDTGAVVTATNGDTQVSALSTNGSVTLELPIEGQWTVTAVRGVAQYNTAIVEVSAHYTASLTAAIHLEYIGTITPLFKARGEMAAVSTGTYAMFAAGGTWNNPMAYDSYVDIYGKTLTHQTLSVINSTGVGNMAGAAVDGITFFAGGEIVRSSGTTYPVVVTRFDSNLTKDRPSDLNVGRSQMGGATIGSHVLFGGGVSKNGKSTDVDVYDSNSTHTSADPLAVAGKSIAASNSSYAMFCNNLEYSSGTGRVTAYDSYLTRSIPAAPSEGFSQTARAGEYVIFTGLSSGLADAYDLFLTRATVEGPGARVYAGCSVNDFAVFLGEENMFVYDKFLVRTTIPASGKFLYSGASVGEYAIFAGSTSLAYTGEVDAYKIK